MIERPSQDSGAREITYKALCVQRGIGDGWWGSGF